MSNLNKNQELAAEKKEELRCMVMDDSSVDDGGEFVESGAGLDAEKKAELRRMVMDDSSVDDSGEFAGSGAGLDAEKKEELRRMMMDVPSVDDEGLSVDGEVVSADGAVSADGTGDKVAAADEGVKKFDAIDGGVSSRCGTAKPGCLIRRLRTADFGAAVPGRTPDMYEDGRGVYVFIWAGDVHDCLKVHDPLKHLSGHYVWGRVVEHLSHTTTEGEPKTYLTVRLFGCDSNVIVDPGTFMVLSESEVKDETFNTGNAVLDEGLRRRRYGAEQPASLDSFDESRFSPISLGSTGLPDMMRRVYGLGVYDQVVAYIPNPTMLNCCEDVLPEKANTFMLGHVMSLGDMGLPEVHTQTPCTSNEVDPTLVPYVTCMYRLWQIPRSTYEVFRRNPGWIADWLGDSMDVKMALGVAGLTKEEYARLLMESFEYIPEPEVPFA